MISHMKTKSPYITYTEDFKRNAVAVINSGMSMTDLSRRLGVPKSTLFTWTRNRKYGDVGKASPEVLSSLPAPEGSGDYRICTFVKVPEGTSVTSGKGPGIESPVRISIGKVGLCFDRGLSIGELRSIVEAFGGGDVL